MFPQPQHTFPQTLPRFLSICRHTMFYPLPAVTLQISTLLMNCRFIATLHWANLSTPLFQSHILTSCLCLIKVNMMALLENTIAHLIDYNVNVTFICTGKQRNPTVTCLAEILLALVQCLGPSPSLSPRCACSSKPYDLLEYSTPHDHTLHLTHWTYWNSPRGGQP